MQVKYFSKRCWWNGKWDICPCFYNFTHASFQRYNIMLSLLPSFVVGIISFLLFCLNTILWCLILFLFAFIKLIIPHAGIRCRLSRLLILIAMAWIEGNSFIFRITQKSKWDVQGLEENLSPDEYYLVISNHRSIVDIFVLQHIFKHRIPFLKFFLKEKLIWAPFLGVAWWALDFPFLR